jgi:hypothetical protein
MLAATFPRIGLLIIWLFTDWIDIAFEGNWFWPLLGIIFLPFTTLMYVFVDIATIGEINLGGWLLIGLGVLVDIMHWGQIIANRQNGQALYSQYGPGGATAA